MTAPTKAPRWRLRLDPGSASLRAAWIAAVRRLEAHRAVVDSDHHDHGGDVSTVVETFGRVIGRIGGLSL